MGTAVPTSGGGTHYRDGSTTGQSRIGQNGTDCHSDDLLITFELMQDFFDRHWLLGFVASIALMHCFLVLVEYSLGAEWQNYHNRHHT